MDSIESSNKKKSVENDCIILQVANIQYLKRGSILISSTSSVANLTTNDQPNETGWKILKEIFLPIFLAALGSVGSGLILDSVKETRVFTKIPEFLIVVTPLLGLKGNIEMTLSSKMSTLSNLGLFENSKKIFLLFIASIGLTQTQSTILAILASIFANIMARINGEPKNDSEESDFLLLMTTCLLTTTLVSFIIRVIMMGVVLLSKKYNINPDNVATPIASSLGDASTLFFFSLIGNGLYDYSSLWINFILTLGSYFLLIIWILMAKKEKNCWGSLKSSFIPIISSMLISSFGGMVLDKSVKTYPDLAVYQPLMNAVGGNLVSVQASRLSTSVQRDNISIRSGQSPIKVFFSPIKIFFKDGISSLSAGILIITGYPVHLICMSILYQISNGKWTLNNLTFYIFYLCAYTLQILILLYLARIFVNLLTKYSLDTDLWSIPFLTAFGDLLGTLGLFCAFYIINLF